MSISSAQPTSSITSDDIISIDLSSITTTLDTSSFGSITLNSGGTSGSGYYIGGGNYGAGGMGGSSGTFTISTGGISTVQIGPLSVSDISIQFPEEWKDCFPDWQRIQKMCDTYPGLKIAFEKFKTTYNLVKDDYDAPPEKRIKP